MEWSRNGSTSRVAADAQHRGSLAAPVIALAHRDHLHPSLLHEAGHGRASA
jgi:hypothetical protein